MIDIRTNPIAFAKRFWPDVTFYREQREVIHSVDNNEETVVVAANKTGKDFVAAFIALRWFLIHTPAKVITTSATDKHLDNLWGEVDRFIRTAAVPLRRERNGPLIYNHHEIRKISHGAEVKDSYFVGLVTTSTSRGEALQGHHTPNYRSLFIVDEASGVPDIAYTMAQGWADRMLILGNPHTCHNFFRKAVKEGDIPIESTSG